MKKEVTPCVSLLNYCMCHTIIVDNTRNNLNQKRLGFIKEVKSFNKMYLYEYYDVNIMLVDKYRMHQSSILFHQW